MRRVFIIGVGMTKFHKPQSLDWDYPDMAREAGLMALKDAGVAYEGVDQACVGWVYGDSTAGQRAVYELGLTGLPVYNVNNNCSTGSTALMMARQFVQGGMSNCVLALGFEKMNPGSLSMQSFDDRVAPLGRHYDKLVELRGKATAAFAPWMYAVAGQEHMDRYGTDVGSFIRIAEKNHRHSANNPYAQFQTVYSYDDIASAPMVADPLTRLMCSPTSDGAAAAVIASEDFVREHELQDHAVEIRGQAMVTDTPATFSSGSVIDLVGRQMSAKAASEVYEQSGRTADDVDVIELHDCFATHELFMYEALGLADEGEGGKLISNGDVTYGGRWVVNPSGGLISKGHPLGATGLAQCAELNWQLRGLAEARQVPNARVALAHNIGLGGAAIVTLYERPEW